MEISVRLLPLGMVTLSQPSLHTPVGLEAPSTPTRRTAEGRVNSRSLTTRSGAAGQTLSLSLPPSLGGGAEAGTSGGGQRAFSKPLRCCGFLSLRSALSPGGQTTMCLSRRLRSKDLNSVGSGHVEQELPTVFPVISEPAEPGPLDRPPSSVWVAVRASAAVGADAGAAAGGATCRVCRRAPGSRRVRRGPCAREGAGSFQDGRFEAKAEPLFSW